MTGTWSMSMRLLPAVTEDAEVIATLRTLVGTHLAAIHGAGHWSRVVSAKDVLKRMATGQVFQVRQRERVIATLCLTTRKPRAIDPSYFSPVRRPIYLVDMAVDPAHQGQGIGRWCLGEVERHVEGRSGGAIRLDAYDGPMGASDFYRRCGYREVGRAAYREVSLVYFEFLSGWRSSIAGALPAPLLRGLGPKSDFSDRP